MSATSLLNRNTGARCVVLWFHVKFVQDCFLVEVQAEIGSWKNHGQIVVPARILGKRLPMTVLRGSNCHPKCRYVRLVYTTIKQVLRDSCLPVKQLGFVVRVRQM